MALTGKEAGELRKAAHELTPSLSLGGRAVRRDQGTMQVTLDTDINEQAEQFVRGAWVPVRIYVSGAEIREYMARRKNYSNGMFDADDGDGTRARDAQGLGDPEAS